MALQTVEWIADADLDGGDQGQAYRPKYFSMHFNYSVAASLDVVIKDDSFTVTRCTLGIGRWQLNNQFSSIHSRLLITSLLPLTLLCIVLASYMISSQRTVLLGNLHNTGSVAAQQISSNAEFAVYSNNQEMLLDLGESVLDIPAVNGLLFYNVSQNTSVTIGELDPIAVGSPQNYEFGKPVYRDHNWYFYSRVTLTPPALEDYDEGQQPAPDVLGWVVVSLTDEILEEQYREGIFAIVLVSTLGLLMAAWLSMRIGRSISRPVELLTGVVESMEAGSLNNLAVEAGPVEVRKLASGINQLATTVRQSNVRMQSEVARATAQLQITLIELEEAMEAQDQFLARMSHELRTPLTAVIGFSKLLSIETDAQKRDENLRIINMSSNMLLTMIDDILEFSKARAGGFTLEKVPFYIESWITDLMSIQRQRAEEKGLTLSYTIDKTVPQALVGDPVRFTQVISNLLSNAIKFTDAGSINVTIRCLSNRDGKVTLDCSVADTGKGIEDAKIPTLFDPIFSGGYFNKSTLWRRWTRPLDLQKPRSSYGWPDAGSQQSRSRLDFFIYLPAICKHRDQC